MRASTSVSLTFVRATGDTPIDPDTGLPTVDIRMETPEGTTGQYGEKIPFNIFVSPSGTAYRLDNSASGVGGVIFPEEDGTITETVQVSFDGTNTASLPYPVSSISNPVWKGNSLGAVSLQGNNVISSQAGFSYLDIDVTRQYFGHSIMVPEQDADEFPVKIVGYIE